MRMDVTVTSPFWKRYRETVANGVVPYQWAVINDERPIDVPTQSQYGSATEIDPHYSHAVRNLSIAAGIEDGEFHGMVFQDTDVYKWLEEAAYTLEYAPNNDLQALCDSVVDLIAVAQQDDGYLVTPFIIRSGRYAHRARFSQLQQSHELYSMGHAIEALVAYHHVTGNTKALRIACGMANAIRSAFGPEAGKIHAADGHPEIELALGRLYESTGDRNYLDLAQFFINVRGTDPEFYERQNEQVGDPDDDIFPTMRGEDPAYLQDNRPLREQTEVQGHAVRAVYLLTGAAMVARLTDDDALKSAVRRLWHNITARRMAITGGIGSTHINESFTYDYDLPNDTPYNETCASVGMAMLAKQMLMLDPCGEYADVLERELYNGALTGIALDGTKFFYGNMLEVDPQGTARNPDRFHASDRRQSWFGCACCPANIARLIASVDQYLYTVDEDSRTIYAHQFIANTVTFDDGVHIEQHTNMPWDGTVRFTVTVPRDAQPVRMGVRIPSWSRNSYELAVNGEDMSAARPQQGFVLIEAPVGTTHITLQLDMSVRFMRANTRVRADAGRIAVMRGPLVYCAEEADNAIPLWNYHVRVEDVNRAISVRSDELEGITTVTVPAVRRIDMAEVLQRDDEIDTQPLYDDVHTNPLMERPSTLTLIPYYAWANRERGQMQVWFDADM